MSRAIRLNDYRKEFTPLNARDENCVEASEKMTQILSRIKRTYSVLIDAVNFLKPVPVAENVKGVCTDGKKLFYNPQNMLAEDEQMLFFQIIHIIFHGLLGHFENTTGYDQRQLSWDVYDMQVIKLFNDAGITVPSYTFSDLSIFTVSCLPETDELFSSNPGFSLYHNAKKDVGLQKKIKGNIKKLKARVPGFLDDHSSWALPLLNLNPEEGLGDRKGGSGDGGSGGWIEIALDMTGSSGRLQNGSIPTEVVNAIARAIRNSGQKYWGSAAGGFEGEEFAADECGIRNYSCLLEEAKKLIEVCSEEDEIDPALYEYGLSIYGDVPIIEPLEITTKRKIGSVVVAVDTSGSCIGSLKEFWTETIEIFSEISDHTEMDKLHYIECDSEISFIKDYDLVDDLETGKGTTHRFTGYGGTDFRPVFKKVNEYEDDGEKIDFLVYFSDGEGSYPDTDPGYPVYFVFPREDIVPCSDSYRPKWVQVLTLDEKNTKDAFA